MSIKSLLQKIGTPPTKKRFFSHLFTALCQQKKAKLEKKQEIIEQIISEEYDHLSRRVEKSGIQESCSVRNVLKTRRLACFLIDDKGHLKTELLPKIISTLRLSLYSLGPKRQHDGVRQEHMLDVLTQLLEKKSFQHQINSITHPFRNPIADRLIRETLQLKPNTTVKDIHAKQAILSALLCYLRQNVGSCFATAPAILITKEQLSLLFKDLKELFETGRLKRTWVGMEYSVPLSPSWGSGDLKQPFFLQKSEKNAPFDSAYSPGIIAALEAVDILEESLSLKEKILKTHNLIEEWLKEEQLLETALLVSMEQLLHVLIRKKYDLTEQDLKDYESRPKPMIYGGLLMHTAPSSSRSSKSKRSASFFQSLDFAKSTFKSLAENALLKAWEFTLASFAENKAGFTQWNLYSSLGLKPDEPEGIGNAIYEILKKKLEEANAEAQAYQQEYEQVFSQVKYLEARFRSASERETKWLGAEYRSRANEFHTLEEMRDKAHQKAQKFASLFDELIDFYIAQFPNYFQEVFDADMRDLTGKSYDDSPAGFRLIYKHGRLETSQWTKINTPEEFIDALSNFFSLTETDMRHQPQFESVQKEISEIITGIISQIKRKEFLETTFHRMARAHGQAPIKNPLKQLDQLNKKPWAYTSGGNMSTLVTTYYKTEAPPQEKERWVENPLELLVFLVDTVKQLPEKVLTLFSENPKKSLLIHSPTHAFLLTPGLSPFKEAWLSKKYTYTWVRDQLIRPKQAFISKIHLHADMMRYLIAQLEEKVPLPFHSAFRETFSNIFGSLSVQQFRELLLDRLKKRADLKYRGQPILPNEVIDHLLYSELPILPSYQFKENAHQILAPFVSESKLIPLIKLFDQQLKSEQFIGAKQFLEICQSIICLITNNTSTAINYPKEIAKKAQEYGFAMPAPIFFGDSNWAKDLFGFVVNPSTGELELWRVDETGTSGYPMSSWSRYLNGSIRDPKWGVLINPFEYST